MDIWLIVSFFKNSSWRLGTVFASRVIALKNILNCKFFVQLFHGFNNQKWYLFNRIVRLGVYNRTAEKEPLHNHEDFNVVTTYISHDYNATLQVNDIALLRLQKRVVYKHQIRPICIQLDSRLKSTSDAIEKFTIVGWGKMETGNLSDILRTADVYRLDKNQCADMLWYNLTDSQICAGSSNLVDACKGDSGGPLYSKVLDGGSGRQTQFGIVSTGVNQCGRRPSSSVQERLLIIVGTPDGISEWTCLSLIIIFSRFRLIGFPLSLQIEWLQRKAHSAVSRFVSS